MVFVQSISSSKPASGFNSSTQPRQITAYANMSSVGASKVEHLANRGKLWYIPGQLPDTPYKDTAFASRGGLPDRENPVAKFTPVLRNGFASLEARFYDNYEELLYHFEQDKINKGLKAATANIINTTLVDTTNSLNILNRVLGMQTRDYFLQSVVTEIPAPNLQFTVDTYTEGTVHAKVPELFEPHLVSHEESRVTKTLYKNVGHIAISEEAELMAASTRNIFDIRQEWTIRDMNRLLDSQIATELETATAQAGSDWGATSGTPPDSTNNPISDIMTAITTIKSNGFNVDFMAMHPRVAGDLLTNKFITGRGNTGTGVDMSADRFTIAGAPAGIIDQGLTNTIAIIGSKDAVWLGRGPTVIAQYNEETAGYRGWLIKQWVYPYLAQAGAIRKLTGVSA